MTVSTYNIKDMNFVVSIEVVLWLAHICYQWPSYVTGVIYITLQANIYTLFQVDDVSVCSIHN
jgi:hypothetical protein